MPRPRPRPRPRPAGELAGALLGGRAARACALCLCGGGGALWPPGARAGLRTPASPAQRYLRLDTLLRQLRLRLPRLPDNKCAMKKICKPCITKLCTFYVFSKQCSDASSAIENLNKLLLKNEFKTTRGASKKKVITLPYKNIYKYSDESMLRMSFTKGDNAQGNMVNVIRQPFECTLCNKNFKTHNQMLDHNVRIHKEINSHQIGKLIDLENCFFDCNECMLKKITWSEYLDHNKRHSHEKTMKNIIEKKLFCVCCLGERTNLVSISHNMFYGDSRIIGDNTECTLDEMIRKMFSISVTDVYKPALICQDCIDRTVNAFNFKIIMDQSSTIIKNCVTQLEENIAKIISSNQNEGKVNMHFDFGKTRIKTESNNCLQNKSDSDDYEFENNSESDQENELPLSEVKKCITSLKKHECTKCNKLFQGRNDFKKHSKSHNLNERHICKYCCKTFMSTERLSSHRKKKHCDTLCPICCITLKQTEIKHHVAKNHGNNPFICNYCEKRFYTKCSILAHIEAKHLNNVSKNCEICGKAIDTSLLHKCKYKCNDCTNHPCIHQSFLVAFKNDQIVNPKSQYKCINCDFTYNYKHQLLSHANKEHLLHFPHVCAICDEKFPCKEELNYHKNSKHKKSMKCPHCDRAFRELTLLEQHVKTCETVYKPFKCDLCNGMFTSEDKMSFHRRKHFPKNYKCQYCEGRYWTKSELNGHLKRSHKDYVIINSKKLYQCTMCHLDFTTKKHLTHHATSHPVDSRHVCRICNASYRSKINYYGHLRRHNIKKDNECAICGKFYTKYNIATHMKSHNTNKLPEAKTEKAFPKNTMCDICGRFLSNQASLVKHREIHKEQEQCPHCLKFVNSTLFERHLRNHDNSYDSKNKTNKRSRKMFNCTKCDYSSIFSDCLEAHENRFHLHVRPFKCDICNKAFYAKITMKEHIRTHSGSKPEQCEQCGNRFVSKKALRLHVRIHTGEKPYPCDLCNEKFLSASRRQAHRIRKHFEPSVQCQICLKMYYTQSAVRIHIRDYHSAEPKQRGKKKRV